MPSTRLAVWLLRVVWLVLPLGCGPAIGGALADAGRAVDITAASLLWAAWTAGLVAVLVPSTVGLTAIRLLAPVAPGVVAVAAGFGADALDVVVGLVVGAAATALALGADVAEAFVQASAYGDERRFPLRTPGPLLLGPLEIAWAVPVATLGAGALLLADRQWIVGGLLLAVGLVTTPALARRFHRLSRRWLVRVPAGLVLHDHFVLTETLMVPFSDVAEVALAERDTQALDLTGGALGLAVEVRLREAATAVLAPNRRGGAPRAMHCWSFLCSPVRPGRALADARRR